MNVFDLFNQFGKGILQFTVAGQKDHRAAKMIIAGFRRVAAQKQIAPSLKVSDKKIFSIYKLVEGSFRKAAMERNESIKQEYLNSIVLKFLQVYEMMGEEMMIQHLKYEVEQYKVGGLRLEYLEELILE